MQDFEFIRFQKVSQICWVDNTNCAILHCDADMNDQTINGCTGNATITTTNSLPEATKEAELRNKQWQHKSIFVRKTGSDILTSLIQGFDFTNSRFQLHDFNVTNSRCQLHEVSFTNSRIQLHEFTNSTSRIQLHEFTCTNLRIQLHEFNSWIREVEFVKLNSWIQEFEFVKLNLWSWIREFVKLISWSWNRWIREVEIVTSWSSICEVETLN